MRVSYPLARATFVALAFLFLSKIACIKQISAYGALFRHIIYYFDSALRKFLTASAEIGLRGRDMWDYITERVLKEAEYIIKTNSTVRAAAAYFSISKSTVHKDVTERLEGIDKELFARVREVLDKNLSERHIRGGMATKSKYMHIENV